MKSTRTALILSALSLMMCVVMLVGTTFAWFTDSVTSGMNSIRAGNLNIELYHQNKGTGSNKEKVTDTTTNLFHDVELWEPGACAYEIFTIKNAGTLSLKYRMAMNIMDYSSYDGHDLTEVLQVVAMEETPVSVEQIIGGVPLKDWQFDSADTPLAPGEEKIIVVAVYWKPTEHDTDYNMSDGKPEPLYIDLGIQLVATQSSGETDSFGADYDEGAENKLTDVKKHEIKLASANAEADIAESGATTVSVAATPTTSTEAERQNTTVEFPEGALTGQKLDIEVKTSNTLFNVTSEGDKVASIDLNLKVNGTPVTSFNGKSVTVTTYISAGLDGVAVSYNGDGEAPVLVSYDKETGKLVFTTTHFSEYDVTGKGTAYALGETDSAYVDFATAAKAAKTAKDNVVLSVGSDVEKALEESAKEKVALEIPDEILDEYKEKNPEKADIMDSFAANVSGRYFNSFTDALAAAKDGDTVKLTKDCDAGTNFLSITKGITVDFGTNTVTGSRTGVFPAVCLQVEAEGKTVTFTGKSGGIKPAVGTGCVCVKKGNLVIDGGEYTAIDASVLCDDTGVKTLTVNGGKFTANRSANYGRLVEDFAGNITVNAGDFTFKNTNSANYMYLIEMDGDGYTCTVNGGNFIANGMCGSKSAYTYVVKADSGDDINVVFTGGNVINADTKGSYISLVNAQDAYVTVTDINFRSEATVYGCIANCKSLSVSGGMFNMSPASLGYGFVITGQSGPEKITTVQGQISGGTYTFHPGAFYRGGTLEKNCDEVLKEGYKAVQNNDGTWSVIEVGQ